MRFWKTDKGNIKISETDIEEINTKKLRDMESYMTQDTHLFCDTIKNNIKIAKLDATDEEKKDRTVVLISHRQSTMKIADKVYSVENGRMS